MVTRRAPTDAELRAMAFGIRVCKHIKSNAIAFVNEDRTLAVGGGATSRIDPVYAAREKAARLKVSLQGSVLVSEALFPFPDGPTLAAEAGATAIAQPGGAMRDEEVIAAADRFSLAMVFTGRAPLPPLMRTADVDEGNGYRQRRPRARAVLAAQSEPVRMETLLHGRQPRHRPARDAGADRAQRHRAARRFRRAEKST